MRSSKEEISLGALSRLTGTRRATLTESLTTLEQEEIVVVRRLMSSITVDVTPYLGLTESVTPLPRMYVCMNDLYNKQTNKHTEHRLTESVTPLERQAIEYRAEDLLVVLDLLQIIKVTHGTPDVSKKAFKVILKAAASDEDKLTGITIALIAAANGKKNLQAYWVRLMEDKDREELTASALQASKEFLKLCSTLRSKAFENPSFDELKSMGTKLLRLNEKVKTRASLVDYLSLKADELEARLSVYKASLLQ